jgi:hypothetical protein
MNAKEVLNKIMTLLSIDNNEVTLTDARDAQGNILQSPTFDLGEDVSVVGEDGSLTKAPDGEHEIELTDSEGNKVVIRIETKDGKIESRENVEESNPADLEDTGVNEEMPVTMADDMQPAHALPNTTDEDPRNSLGSDTDETDSPIISELKARISELELELESYKMAEELPTEELPKLDGAPIEEDVKKMSVANRYGSKNKIADPQNTFLSRLYKNK